ncbi:hypothetical protein OU426_07885 [Frigidibacter sp. RF13]|uniref:hypothetical protein n=1 Tax=Frigidibacter sp. RF13 TaxID=2997340 RepID=UPI002270DDDA|nr:hypothetical protein [Frigidibacter sp. RF13]MCY1126768.1 hypothetical protein [Frigidibacter sp. RF13]
MTPADRARQLARLKRVAEARRDSDLAALSSVTARLAAAEQAREDLAQALAAEVRKAVAEPEMPTFRALDMHLILSERTKTALEARITRIAAERDAQRAIAAASFGRAAVLDELAEWVNRLRPSGER